jgi:hypothetical protein
MHVFLPVYFARFSKDIFSEQKKRTLGGSCPGFTHVVLFTKTGPFVKCGDVPQSEKSGRPNHRVTGSAKPQIRSDKTIQISVDI